MMRLVRSGLLFGVLLWLLLPGAALAGGWAVITLEAMPAGIAPERESVVGFWVGQHGTRPVGGLQPVLEFVHQETGRRLTFNAVAGDREGYYRAVVRLPVVRTWSIWSSFGEAPMPPVTVRAAAPASPATVSQPAGFTDRTMLAGLLSLGALVSFGAADWSVFAERKASRRRAV